jgi:hypothetical protein
VTVNTAELHGAAVENVGIAGIIPSQKVLDILNSPRARAYIDRAIANNYAAQGRTIDADALFKEAIDALISFDPNHSDLKAARMDYAAFLDRTGNFISAASQRRLASSMTSMCPEADDNKK